MGGHRWLGTVGWVRWKMSVEESGDMPGIGAQMPSL